ncbi:Transthyretin-like family protein [Ostertagia ostertagi]
MKIVIASALLIGSCLSMRDQSYAVRGKLMCGPSQQQMSGIKLWEEDTVGPDPDDLLDSGYTDGNGEFRLGGGTAEMTPIDPIFKVYHDCDDGMKPGKRKVKFYLPKSYITAGKTPKKEFDIGVLNLETIFPKEEREFIVTRRRRARKEDTEDSDAFDYYSRMRFQKDQMQLRETGYELD